MREELFRELLESAKEAMAIRRGDAEPSRVFELDEIDVVELREKMKLSQPKFAALLGISVGTLRGWEQGRRRPDGPARALLRVAAARPDAVLDALGGVLRKEA
jgi:putative transcriptional regulator